MSQPEITHKVREVLARQLGIAEGDITPERTWNDLGADSLDEVEIMMAFEEEFGLEIPEEEAERLKTVGELIEFLENRCEVSS